jgi:spore germination protein YaaH/P2-related tail formation protein
MSRQRTRHFAVALISSVVVTAAAALPAVAGANAPPRTTSPISTVAGTHTSREVFGYALASSLSDPTMGYPSWNFDLLTTVAFFGVHVNTAGQFAADNGWTVWNSSALTSLVSTAHQHGVKVVLTVILQDFSPNTPNMCAGLSHADATVTQTVAEVRAKGVDGVNIDYEGLDGGCGTGDPYWAQHAMNTFAQKMRAGLGSSSYLSIATYAGAAADGYGFFDVVGLSNYVDAFFVMAYDMEYSNYSGAPLYCSRFCLGPTSPLTGYRYNGANVMSQYTAAVPASKVLFGVPYYGRKACVGGTGPNQYPTSSVVADSYLDASGEAAYFEVKPGTYVTHRDANSSGGERWDTWYNTTLNCTRELYWDDVVSLGKKYDLVNSDGLRGVGLWNLNYGGGATELWGALSSHFARCAGATISTAPASPQGTGARVTITAGSTGCASPQYRFWVEAPGGAWVVVQDFGVANTYAWPVPSVGGLYHLEADVRASAATSYDSVANTTYSVNPCTAAALTAAPASPQRPGTAIVLTGSATCLGTPQYRFWVRPPGGAWAIAQDYGPPATFSWNTTGKPSGAYGLEVDVRNQGSTATYETVANITFKLDPPCGSPTLATSPTSPQGTGAVVTFTATTAGCPSPLYKFWVQPPGGTWSVVQPYSPAATYSWKTAGLAPGTYRLEVDVRDQSSTAAYDGVANLNDVLSPCTRATLSTDKASPQPPATTILLTGAATCAGTAQYRFWVRQPGGSWAIAQDFSPTGTYALNTTGKPSGVYGLEVDVRNQGSTAVYETVANLTYLIDACTSAKLTASPASPQAHGTTIVLTGSASCLGTPQYRFWVRATGGTWAIVQDYGASSTFSWSTTTKAAGTYYLEVDVRDTGSTAVYETVANITFAIS